MVPVSVDESYYGTVLVYLLLTVTVTISSDLGVDPPLPVVLWHGIGDCCCNPGSLGRIKHVIEKAIPGVYVYSVRIGNSVLADTENGYFMPPNKQIDIVCEQLQHDPNLQGGYHGLGFSQGAQFLRGLAERCPNPPMKNLVSLGGQHQGVYGLPRCPGDSKRYCDYIRKLLNHAYSGWVQDVLAPAGYWHDPHYEETYKNNSRFLADINNERSVNEGYVQNILNLNKLVLVKFNNDTIVQPPESSWFGYYQPDSLKVVALNQTRLWLEDRLGLKRMGDRLVFLETNGDHLQFTEEWFLETIVGPYLKTR